MGKRYKTKLLYSLDLLGSQNFHKYIDGKENILLIVKLTSGCIIGGYCATSFLKDKLERHKKGFLFSLLSFEYGELTRFNPKESSNHPLTTYDEYFMIFGNSELRIKSQERKIYSNFGANAGMFATEGWKVGQLLGGQGN